MIKEYFSIFNNQNHRTNLKIQVIAGLILFVIITFLVWAFNFIPTLWELIIFIPKAIIFDVVIPLWLVLIMLLTLIFLLIKILLLQKIVGQNKSTGSNTSLNKLDLPDKERLILSKLVSRYSTGEGKTLEELSSQIPADPQVAVPLAVDQILDSLIEKKLVDADETDYYLTKNGRDIIVELIRQNKVKTK